MKPLITLFFPAANTTSLSEKLISGLAAFSAILLVMLISQIFIPSQDLPLVVASFGASAVLLFAVPLGPLSQPWSLVGGHLISAFIGITVAKLIPDIAIASALAVGLSISIMYISACLHPPGAATALSAVVGGSTVLEIGYEFMLFPVALNILVMLIFALVINNLMPRRYYPNTLKAYQNRNKPEQITEEQATLSVSREDIKYALKEIDAYIDVSDENLNTIFNLSATRARRKRMGEIYVNDIMQSDVITAEYGDTLENIWMLMAKHKIRSIPIIDKLNRIQGIITIADFLNQVKAPTADPLKERLEYFLQKTERISTDKPEYAGHLMQTNLVTIHPDQHILDLFPIFYTSGIHHLPVVDHDKQLVGIITPKNLMLALHADLQT
ncbi:MAG: HPP family protein [Cocleimonas sp.]|nr:HPP family protein [Cocleimonas sp.]